MRLTPFKTGLNEGWNTSRCSYDKYKGRRLKDYISGLRQGIIRATLKMIDKEQDPVNTITDPGLLHEQSN